MTSLTDLASDRSCPACGSPVTLADLLVWPDGIATGLCTTCHRDLLFPLLKSTANADEWP